MSLAVLESTQGQPGAGAASLTEDALVDEVRRDVTDVPAEV